MTSTATDSTEIEKGDRLPEIVDWLVGIAIAIGGLIAIVGGAVLAFAIDRGIVVENAEFDPGPVEVLPTQVTEPELLEVGLAIITWTGIGLLVAGVGMVVFAGWFVRRRRRSHTTASSETPGSSFGAFAVVGAVTTVLASALPFSSAIGGGVAGYLERAESTRTARVGALSGALSVLPFAVVVLFLVGGVWVGFGAIGQTGLAIAVSGLALVTVAIAAGVSIGLAALGGYVGGRLAER